MLVGTRLPDQDAQNWTSGTSMACGYSLVFPLRAEQDETIPNLIRRRGGLLVLDAVAHPDVGWTRLPDQDVRNKFGMWVLSGLLLSRRT